MRRPPCHKASWLVAAAIAWMLLSSTLALPGQSPADRPTSFQKIAGNPAPDRVSALRADLETIFNDTHMENAFWGVMIQSLETGEIIYQQNHRKLLMPASNMKLPTAVTALLKLGPDYTYETKIYAAGNLRDGKLLGHLIVVGSGDPTIGARFGDGDPTKTFKDWAARLKAQGIRQIQGDLIGVDEVFDQESLGQGWSWNDIPYGYSAE